MNIKFITCEESILGKYFPTKTEPDLIPHELPFTPDDELAVNALRDLGVNVKAVIWGEKNIQELKSSHLLVMRSPWDYTNTNEIRLSFIDWLTYLKGNQIKTENNIDFMLWLINKQYLKDLEKESIPIVPTEIINQHQKISLEEVFANRGPFILKPCYGAAGKGLQFIDSKNKAIESNPKFQELIDKESYLLQPFIPEIKSNGEWSLVFLDGNYSHAIHKKTGDNSILVQAEHGGSLNFIEPQDRLIKHAGEMYPKILQAFRAKYKGYESYIPLYLRCDFIETKNQYLLSECEGVEPELFFRVKPDSAKSFAKSIIDRVDSNAKLITYSK